MPRPTRTPLGVALARTAKAVERAFDDALAAAGGSRPVWLVLVTLKATQPSAQNDLAAALDIREATVTHHLNAMEAQGLVTRTRNPENRRVHQVRLTAAGDEAFHRLAGAARAHDARLRGDLADADLDQLRSLLDRLQANVAPTAGP